MSIAELCVYAIGSLGGEVTTGDVGRFFAANGDAVPPRVLAAALDNLASRWRPPALERVSAPRGPGYPATWRLAERGRRMIADEGA